MEKDYFQIIKDLKLKIDYNFYNQYWEIETTNDLAINAKSSVSLENAIDLVLRNIEDENQMILNGKE